MKVLSLVLSIVMCITLFSMPVLAQETLEFENNNNIVSTNQNEEPPLSFTDMCVEILLSTNTIVSIVMILLLGAYVLIFEKDFPKKWGAIIPACYLLVLFFVRLFLRMPAADVLVTITIIIILGIAFIVNVRLTEKQKVTAHEGIIPKNTTEKRALTTIQRLLNRSHSAIECIQLYSYDHTSNNEEHIYDIKFLGGASKKGVNINALFSSTIKIPKEYVDGLTTILSTYSKLTNDENNLNEAEQNAVSILISAEIDKLKEVLNNIKAVNNITDTDCYIARILLLYISLYATIQDHDTYIGLGRDSLNLNNPELETELFTFERTGILGSLLFDHTPYVFSYKRGGNKVGRFYYTFSLKCKKRYIIMISMKNKTKENYIDYYMSENLNKIQDQLSKILEENNTKQEKEGD